MNFVLGLTKTLRKHDSTLVIVDRFSKIAYFLPCSQTANAFRVIKIFLTVLSNCMVFREPLCLIEMWNSRVTFGKHF